MDFSHSVLGSWYSCLGNDGVTRIPDLGEYVATLSLIAVRTYREARDTRVCTFFKLSLLSLLYISNRTTDPHTIMGLLDKVKHAADSAAQHASNAGGSAGKMMNLESECQRAAKTLSRDS